MTNKAAAKKKKPSAKVVAAKTGRSVSLVETAYQVIKEKIITLHFLPGQYLNEASICTQLELGRTPVHQALQLLHVEGLVEILPRKGIIVQPDSLGEIIKILDSRLAVEPELARYAARRVRNGETDRGVVAEMLAVATATDQEETPPDITLFTTNDRRFHALIAQISGNEVLSDFARKLHERSTRFWYLNLWQTLDVRSSNQQHARIAAAIDAGNEEEAANRMYEHISALRERLTRIQAASPNAFRASVGH